jgi:MFS family permease
MGVAYSCLASSLWPLVSLIIPEHQLGTAYGVCQSVQNLGLAVFNIVAGTIVEHYGYTWVEVFFIGSLSVALATTIILWLLDLWQDGILNMTPKKRLARLQLLAVGSEKDVLQDDEADTSYGTMQPSTDFEIRNRYLSRIGAPVSDSIEE